MTEKEMLRRLVEELPEAELHAALRFVEFLRQEASDPVARALREAPFDDEPLSAEDVEELEAAEEDRVRGALVSHGLLVMWGWGGSGTATTALKGDPRFVG